MSDELTPGAGKAATLMNLARGAKGIALLGFLLPWVTVSCAGQPLVKMTGLQMATGNVQPMANPTNPLTGQPTPGPSPVADASQGFDADLLVILVAVLIVAGLVASFVLPRGRAALVGMIAAIAAAAVAAFEVLFRIQNAVSDSIRESASKAGNSPLGGGADREMQQLLQVISVDASIGFWITLLALIAAAVLFGMVRSRREAPGGFADAAP